MKTVSIVFPVYQVSDYIERSLGAVMNQTFPGIECIIVDDATRDDSVEKIERLIGRYTGSIRFIILHHKENRGLSAARNTGTDAATGDYVYYLDSDDEITPDCIEKLVKATEVFPNAEMVIGNSHTIKDGQVVRTMVKDDAPSIIRTNDDFFNCYHQQKISVTAWNKLIKRPFIEENHLRFKEGIIHEDVLWMFYVAKYLSKVVVSQDITYYYYKRPGSIMESATGDEVGKSYSIIYEEILHHLSPGHENRELSRYVEGFCKRYLTYRATFPEYEGLFELFQSKSSEHECKMAQNRLRLTSLMSRLPFGLEVLRTLNNLRR